MKKQKPTYFLHVNDHYTGLNAFFILVKKSKKKWRWNLFQIINSEECEPRNNYVPKIDVPKWKALNWAQDYGIVYEVKKIN